VTAYTSFSGSTEKAKNSAKIGHIVSIETGLNTFFVDKSYYPMPSQYNATKNIWGYNGAVPAALSNTFTGTINNSQIESIASGS
jgi:hypothetical protein